MTQTVTLTDVRTEQVARLRAGIDATAALSAQAAADQSAAQQAVSANEAVITQLQAEASASRQQFATATMRPDQHAIELHLYDNLTSQREAGITLAGHRDQLAALTQQAQALAARVTTLQGALAQASADLSAAEQQDAAAAADRAALATSVADAVHEAGGDEVKAQVAAATGALAQLTGGPGMADVLRARYDHAQTISDDQPRAVARAQRAASAVAALTSPASAALDTAAASYNDMRTTVHGLATAAPGDLAAAREALQRTAGAAAFSPAVAADISTRAKAATDAGAAAADQAFHTAAAAAVTTSGDLDAVTAPKAAADPGYDPAGDDTVKAQRDAAEAAAQTLTATSAARTADLTSLMASWDLSLPPEALALAIATFAAQSRIAELAALDVTALAAGLDAAETAYAGALAAQAGVDALRQAAADKLSDQEAAAARYAAAGDQRVLAAVRGDL